jgi:hypothetical protein
MTVENGQILDNIRETRSKGGIKAFIPRDSRHNLKERERVLQIRYAQYKIKKPQIKNKNKVLPPSLPVKVMYVKEEQPPQGVEVIAWFLMMDEEADSVKGAYEKVE